MVVKTDDPKKDEKTKEVTEQPKDETASKVSELEKKLGELSETIGTQNEFIQSVTPVINAFAFTPELKKAWDEYGRPKVVGTGEGVGQQETTQQTEQKTVPSPQGQNPVVDQRLEEVTSSQREEIVTAFERDYGIGNLKDEERKDARRKVETYLNEFGWSVKNIPLPQLRNSLEKAYVGSHAEKLKEEGKLEGFAQARANENAMMGTMPSTGIQSQTSTQEFTPKQKEWMKKLRVDEEKAKQTYFSKDEEEFRVSGAEKRAQKKAEEE